MLNLETGRTKKIAYSLTARCNKGRLERLAPLLIKDSMTILRPYALRLPFDGIIRFDVPDGKTTPDFSSSTLSGKFKLLRGAFDIRAADSSMVEMNVLSGLISFSSVLENDKTLFRTNLELTLKSPLEEIDPEPVVLKIKNAFYGNDELKFEDVSLRLFGEIVSWSGKVDKFSTVKRLNLSLKDAKYSLASLAKKVLPLNAGISLKGTLDVKTNVTGTWKYPKITGGLTFDDVNLDSYYQKGIPFSFKKAEVEFTDDNIYFKPFPVKLGLKDVVFPAVGGLKEVLETDNVWNLVLLKPMVAWNKITKHISHVDRQNLISKAIGKEEFATIIKSAAHRIKTWIWTKTREEPYVYDAFLTNEENLAFDNSRDDIVRRYEDIAKRNLAAKEGFSFDGFGENAFRMLRIKKISSSVMDRDGNQVWPEKIPKWRLDRTPGIR